MSNYKNNVISPGIEQEPPSGTAGDTAKGNGKPGYQSTLRNSRMRKLITPEGRDMAGWESYRRWLSRVQSPGKRRSPMDPALYTWKGYRSWSEKVRRDWKPDE
jgi:hypothetical protein